MAGSIVRNAVPRRFAPPRAAYIHVPFCRHRCGYCNFTLVAGRDDLIGQYLAALDRELSALGSPREVETLFLGGGTPTHLDPIPLRQLLGIVHHWFPLAAEGEFTAEANPLDITPERIAVLREGHVTRISLGAQSFDSSRLRLLERDHQAGDIVHAVRQCKAHFASVSLDLIFGIPGQTVEQWQEDLQAAIDLGPQHVSIYGLTFERGTRFWSRRERGELTGCAEEVEREMYEGAIDRLTAAGYEHYEVASFALPGFRCRHNATYWTGRTYYAAGPGAARHIDGRRETNHRSTTTYLQRVLRGDSPVAESELLDPEAAARERLVIGLRQLDGIELEEFETDVGFTLQHLAGHTLDRFQQQGLVEQGAGRLRLTRAGLLVSDSLWAELLTPAANR